MKPFRFYYIGIAAGKITQRFVAFLYIGLLGKAASQQYLLRSDIGGFCNAYDHRQLHDIKRIFPAGLG